jgi:hypothetical protein
LYPTNIECFDEDADILYFSDENLSRTINEAQ